jgi:hypothetical protein
LVAFVCTYPEHLVLTEIIESVSSLDWTLVLRCYIFSLPPHMARTTAWDEIDFDSENSTRLGITPERPRLCADSRHWLRAERTSILMICFAIHLYELHWNQTDVGRKLDDLLIVKALKSILSRTQCREVRRVAWFETEQLLR